MRTAVGFFDLFISTLYSHCVSRHSFVRDHALAHELAGVHFMRRGDEYWTKHNIKLAHEAYVDWQANVKADHLQLQYPKYILDNLDQF